MCKTNFWVNWIVNNQIASFPPSLWQKFYKMQIESMHSRINCQWRSSGSVAKHNWTCPKLVNLIRMNTPACRTGAEAMPLQLNSVVPQSRRRHALPCPEAIKLLCNRRDGTTSTVGLQPAIRTHPASAQSLPVLQISCHNPVKTNNFTYKKGGKQRWNIVCLVFLRFHMFFLHMLKNWNGP